MSDAMHEVHAAFSRIKSAADILAHLLDTVRDSSLLRDQVDVVANAIRSFAETGEGNASAVEKGG